MLRGWFVDLLPDLNQEEPLVSRYLTENTMWWVETLHADALRLDTFPYVGRGFWKTFHATLQQAYPHLTDVGEVFNDTMRMTPAINAAFAGGVTQVGTREVTNTGLWTPFDYPFYQTIRDVLLKGRPASDLADLFAQDGLYPHPERLEPLIGSHDTSRFVSEPGASPRKLQAALGLLYMVRGTPVLYSGDEIGMAGGQDPDNRRDFPGGFGGADRFAKPSGDRNASEMLSYVQELARFRRSQGDLIAGQQQVVASDQQVFAFVRGGDLATGCQPERDRLLVLANLSEAAASLDLPLTGNSLAGCTPTTVRIGSAAASAQASALHVNAPPLSVTAIRMH